MSSSMFSRWRDKFGASLSLKLIGIFVGGSIALVMLIGSVSRFGLERQVFMTARPVLSHYIEYLSDEVGTPPSTARAEEITERWPLIIRIFDPVQDLRWASDGKVREPRINEHRKDRKFGRRRAVFWDHGTVFLRKNAGEARVYYGLRLRHGGPPWVPLAFISLVLLGLVGFYLLTRKLFAPIQQIETGIAKIGDGQLDHRITIKRRDELGRLADQVNQMAKQLGGMMQAKRDLLLALSHELKSPLARSRVTLALLEDTEERDALLDDQQEMQRLIDQIIAAERTQGDFAIIHRESTDMRALIEGVVAKFEPPNVIEISVSLDEPVNVDSGQIERLLRNLLENALRYNRPEIGPVKLNCDKEAGQMVLVVADHGPGVEAQHLDRLTEAFYRADASRERKTGGLGLGLYLCQAVVNAHKGTLEISSEVGQGMRVTCRIPV